MLPDDLVLAHLRGSIIRSSNSQTVTWAVVLVTIGGAAALLAAPTFWSGWSPVSFGLFLSLLVATAVAGVWLLALLFRRWSRAAHLAAACGNIAAQWARAGGGAAPSALEPTVLDDVEFGDAQFPRAVAEEYLRLSRGGFGLERFLLVALVIVWSLAALTRVTFSRSDVVRWFDLVR